MSTVLLSGASGFIGSRLARALESRGDRVARLTRRGASGPSVVRWDAESGQIDEAALAALRPDLVVNLAGETIAQRWTASRKRRIYDSRVNGTAALARTIAALTTRPRALISGSAIGYYGANRGDEMLTEASTPGAGFLATVSRDWESATAPARDAGIRVALIRISTVMGSGGGALAPLLPLFRFGLGGSVGCGRNWFSWIGLEDMVRAILFLADSEKSGAFNLASPAPVPYATFATTLGRVLRRPAVVPVPAFAMKLVFGEMAEQTILASQRVLPARLREAGFAFRHPDLEEALRAELSR